MTTPKAVDPRPDEGRPDFAGFAEALRTEARWSAQIHGNDPTGQARSDQQRLYRLAVEVENAGRLLGFIGLEPRPSKGAL